MMAYKLPTDIFAVPLYGYIVSPVMVLTIFSNTMTCIVLLKKHMRNPTYVLLLSIALIDMFTGVSALPGNIYYYSLGNYKEYIPYNLCRITQITYEIAPVILHSASNWLSVYVKTLAVALQRYICVCHTQIANRWCTIPSTIRCIIAICILAILVHFRIIIWTEFTPLEIPSLLDPAQNTTGCLREQAYVQTLAHALLFANLQLWFT